MLKSEAISRQEQLGHLAQVRALTQAVASSISAIEKNDLQQFEIHLAAQESLCNRLSGSKWIPPSTPAEMAVDGITSDAPLLHEIRQAYIALAKINRVYAGVLKHARKSLEVIIGLYQIHGEGYSPGPSPTAQRHSHTWSCEV
jgi:hypothetical protein